MTNYDSIALYPNKTPTITCGARANDNEIFLGRIRGSFSPKGCDSINFSLEIHEVFRTTPDGVTIRGSRYCGVIGYGEQIFEVNNTRIFCETGDKSQVALADEQRLFLVHAFSLIPNFIENTLKLHEVPIDFQAFESAWESTLSACCASELEAFQTETNRQYDAASRKDVQPETIHIETYVLDGVVSFSLN